MRIKVVKAADLKEAMAMVKDELGRDAVILHTKRYKQGGFWGYKSKEVVEVTAAVDDTPRRPRVKLPAMPRAPRPAAPAEAPESEPAKPQMAARPPRNVLSQYKTAGTEAGVTKAREQSRVSEPIQAADGETFEPQPILRTTPTMQPRRQAKPRKPRISVHPAPTKAETIHEDTVIPTIESIQSALAEPILPKRESKPEAQQETVLTAAELLAEAQQDEPSEVRPQPKPKAVKKEKSRVIKAEEFASMTAKETMAERAEVAETTAPPAEPAETAAPLETPAVPVRSEEMPEPQESEKQEKINALEDELAQMRQMLRQVMNQSASGEGGMTLKDALSTQALRDDVMQDMIRKIPPATMMLGKESQEAVRALSDYLHSVLKTGDGIGLKDGRPKIVALIGTTGVGKTTTIAKIAAKYVLERGVSVALITADTYRISAVDQLRTYSDIIGLPLEIVYSPAELKPALRKHRDKKLILIDTAGRSQNNEYQMDELKEFLAVEPSIEKHLVLSATTKERDAEMILERFAACRPDRILMTKTDETDNVGFIVNLLFDRRLAMSYLTTGQSVPDDIEPAKPEALARLMLR
ncbi:MAG: flagellar biosynthesis protein FlhF [Schwartzia sp.]|nr:flagellar biosynthesis protein FlhF [Schwartzia sp. (in: firmicutes)]